MGQLIMINSNHLNDKFHFTYVSPSTSSKTSCHEWKMCVFSQHYNTTVIVTLAALDSVNVKVTEK